MVHNNYHLHSLGKVTVQNNSYQPPHYFGGSQITYYLGDAPRKTNAGLDNLKKRGAKSKVVGKGHCHCKRKIIKK